VVLFSIIFTSVSFSQNFWISQVAYSGEYAIDLCPWTLTSWHKTGGRWKLHMWEPEIELLWGKFGPVLNWETRHDPVCVGEGRAPRIGNTLRAGDAICVFNTVNLGTSASSPYCHSARGNVSRGIAPSNTTRVFVEYFLKISVHKNS